MANRSNFVVNIKQLPGEHTHVNIMNGAMCVHTHDRHTITVFSIKSGSRWLLLCISKLTIRTTIHITHYVAPVCLDDLDTR